jgi:endonuclease/exonuclease/phosphatase (EEP) superfamily protein YafD
LARLVAHDAAMLLVWANSFTLYLYLPAYLVVAWAVWRRKWRLFCAAAVVVVCHLIWVVPDWRPAAAPSPAIDRGVAFRVFSANLRAGNRDRQGLIDEIRASDPDILLLQEYSPSWRESLTAACILSRFEHKSEVLRSSNFGEGVYSKWPLVEENVLNADDAPIICLTVLVEGRRVRLYNIHSKPPSRRMYHRWREQWPVIFEHLQAETGPTMAVGDFNLTQHSVWHARLSATRLRSAHEDRGRGSAVTWPNGEMRLPPIRIDHAMISPEFACQAIYEGEGRGSDHRPLILDLVLLPEQ